MPPWADRRRIPDDRDLKLIYQKRARNAPCFGKGMQSAYGEAGYSAEGLNIPRTADISHANTFVALVDFCTYAPAVVGFEVWFPSPASLEPCFPRALLPSSPASLESCFPRVLLPSSSCFPRVLLPSSPASLESCFPRVLLPSSPASPVWKAERYRRPRIREHFGALRSGQATLAEGTLRGRLGAEAPRLQAGGCHSGCILE
jgi:hypothetical protein